MKVNLHVVGQNESNEGTEGLAAFLTGPDPLEELLSEFAHLSEDLEQEVEAAEIEREREREIAMALEVERLRVRENEFIPEQSPLERVLEKMRTLEEDLKYMSFLTHEIEQFGQ